MSTPAGWYDDGSGRQRWWDGTQWTEHFAPAAETATGTDAGLTPAAAAPAQPADAPAFAPPTIPASPDGGLPPYAAPAAPAAAPAQAYPAAAPAETAPKKKPHVLAWIALAVSVIGFIFACIPGALVVGWVLLPIGLILSIVALFLKGAKWPAITGLILAVVGAIVGAIVFFSLLFATAQEAFDEFTDSSVTEGPVDDADDADTDDSDAGDSDEVGSRENPAALGSTISGEEYDVVINSVALDATADVLAANQFNEQPAEGYAYAVVNATVTYTGDESGYALMAMIDYVTSTGEVISSADSLAVPPEPAIGLQELYTDASATGNIVLEVPVGDDGLLRVTPGMFADEVFVAVQ
ncbi:DUF2510 domain-containing protein [Microbacterium sp. CIAB417]|uniref:DUF2510 domain-containing protein n=1 Tax=Microbacterium sp. CIAB417 TaxID=2860287 RepID=UPI001FACCF00|nr:DUF2510 domain-containing protein [Microbacterium sp. CIAB417]